LAASFLLANVLATCAATAIAGPPTAFQPTAQDEFIPDDAQLELVWGEGQFTEGPVPAADGSILFSDIGNRIMRYDPNTGRTTVFREPSGRSNGMMFDPKGRLTVCEGANTGGGRRISVTEADGTVRTLADRYQGKRFNSPNDLAIDRKGRVYFTDPRYVGDEPRELDFQAVFVIQPSGEVRIATREVEKPNGILVSPDGDVVYVSDNNGAPGGNRQLLRFAAGDDGTLIGREALWTFSADERGIDGMTLDVEGNIYAAAGRGAESGIYIFSPDGEPLAWLATPGAPTNCVFGVGREASMLYVTAPVAGDAGETRRYGLYRMALKKSGYHLFPSGGESDSP